MNASFTVIGTPCSGPHDSPRASAVSASRARWRARSASSTGTARMRGIQPVDAREIAVEQFERRHLLAADQPSEFVGRLEGEFDSSLASWSAARRRGVRGCPQRAELRHHPATSGPGEAPHEARDRADETRDQHLLAGAHAAGAFCARQRRRRPKAPTRSRRIAAPARHRRLHRARRTARAPSSWCRSPPARGRAARWTTARSSTSRGASATRWRRAATACCSTCTARWSREATTTAKASCCAASARSRRRCRSRVALRHARQPVRRDRRARQRDRRLPDLSAHRHVRDRPARRAARCWRMLQGKAKPTMAWGRQPMLPHVMRQGSRRFAQPRAAGSAARRWRREGALCASLFVGFPHADIAVRRAVGGRRHRQRPRAGAPLVRRAARDGVVAARASSSTRSAAGANRSRRPRRCGAKPAGSGPVVLLDHSDNCASGGTMDTMTRARRDPRRRARRRGRVRDLRPAGGAADDRRRRRRDGHAVARRQARHAGCRPEGRAAHRERHRATICRRPLPQPRADGARRSQRHGADARCSTPAA